MTPLVGSLPLQPSLPLPPEAVQLLTPLEVQLRPKLPPGATVAGAGAWKVTLALGPPLEELLPEELDEPELLDELELLEECAPEEELELPEELDELLLEELELLDELLPEELEPEEEELPPPPLSLLQAVSSAPAPSIETPKVARSSFMPVTRFIGKSPECSCCRSLWRRIQHQGPRGGPW